jgi:hypothetical protein
MLNEVQISQIKQECVSVVDKIIKHENHIFSKHISSTCLQKCPTCKHQIECCNHHNIGTLDARQIYKTNNNDLDLGKLKDANTGILTV